MLKAIEANSASVSQLPPTSQFVIVNWQDLVCRCKTLIVICCLLVGFVVIASMITRRDINIYLPNTELDGATFFVLKYETDVVDGSALVIDNFNTVSDDLMKQWQLTGITTYSAQFIPSSENISGNRRATKTSDTRYKDNKPTKGDTLVLLLSIENPPGCISTKCVNSFISKVKNTITQMNQNLGLSITFANGQRINAQLTFSSYQQSSRGYIEERMGTHTKTEADGQRHKRQVTESPLTTNDTTTASTAGTNPGSGSLIDIPQPIFFPKVVGSFQLALQSDQSIVVIIGNDQNIYLSPQSLSGISPSTFSLVDLALSSQPYVALIQDAQNQRYLHSYNDIRKNGYSRVRTHLDTYMPCQSNIMFWTFVRGYLQFYRDGDWFYDTAACLDPLTGFVKIWLVNGQQGLTALQAKYGTCGLAPLVAINY